MMKRLAFLLLLFISAAGYAQQTINNYKYVLVPQRFSFSREEDQYGLNSQTLALLGKKGFTAYSDNGNLPQDIAGNRCTALTADVVQKKGMFVTNLTLILKDCQGNIVFKGKEGKSWEKEFVVAYNQALQEAFKTLNETPYSYAGPSTQPATVAQQTAAQPAAAAPVVQPAPAAQPVASAPVVQPAPAAAPPTGSADATKVLYAQATATGFQLIDTSPKIILTLFNTSVPEVYIADGTDAHGVVQKTGSAWYFESYKNGKLVKEPLQIKF